MKLSIILGLALCLFFLGCESNPSVACEQFGGNWLADHLECEYISQENCDALGGSFEECESACRHTKSEICTTECVPVCRAI